MKITGLQNFKSNTVGEAPAQATGRATTSDGEALPTEEIADAFRDAETPPVPAVSNPFDLWGEAGATETERPYVTEEGVIVATSTDRRTPSLDALLSQYPKLRFFLDDIRTKYVAKQDEFYKKIEELKKQLRTATPEQAGPLNREIERLKNEIVYINQDLQKLDQMLVEQQAVWKEEKLSFSRAADFKDVAQHDKNLDGWIGKPNEKDSYKLLVGKDGRKIIADSKGQPITLPYPNGANYEWEISSGGLNLIDKQTAEKETNSEEDEGVHYDAYLQLATPGQKDHFDRPFNAQISLNLPPYIWVQKGEDGEAKIDDDTGQYIPKEFKQEGERIFQSPPEETDLDQWVQVRIGSATVTSVQVDTVDGKKVEKTVDGKKVPARGFHQVLTIGDAEGTTTLAKLKIVGAKTGGNPGSINIDRHTHYFFASTAQMHLDAKDLLNPIELNAADMESTGRTLLAEDTAKLYEQLGYDDPMKRVGDRKDAAKEAVRYNIEDAYIDKTPRMHQRPNYGAGSVETAVDDYSSPYAGTSIYVGDESGQKMGGGVNVGSGFADTENERTLLSGLVVTEFRGIATMSAFNDLVTVRDVKEFRDQDLKDIYEKENIPYKDGADWMTVIEGNGGRNAVWGKTGNLYATDIGFLWKESQETREDVYVTTGGGISGSTSSEFNPKNFLHIKEGTGAHIEIDNPFDASQQTINDKKDEDGNVIGQDTDDVLHGTKGDDYYDVPRGALWSTPNEGDIPGYKSGRNKATSNEGIMEKVEEVKAKILDEAIAKRIEDKWLENFVADDWTFEGNEIYSDNKNWLDAAFAAFSETGIGGGDEPFVPPAARDEEEIEDL